MKSAILAVFCAALPAFAGDSARRPVEAAAPRLWDRLTAWARPDALPSVQTKPGEAFRVNGKAYVMGEPLGGGNTALVRSAVAADGSRVAVKVLAPEFKNDPLGENETGALKGLARTDIPHARLLNASADGSVLIKELIEGPRLSEVEKLDSLQLAALVELARRMTRVGHTADLTENNLMWNGVEWKLVDAGGFRPAPKEATYSQLKQRLGP